MTSMPCPSCGEDVLLGPQAEEVLYYCPACGQCLAAPYSWAVATAPVASDGDPYHKSEGRMKASAVRVSRDLAGAGEELGAVCLVCRTSSARLSSDLVLGIGLLVVGLGCAAMLYHYYDAGVLNQPRKLYWAYALFAVLCTPVGAGLLLKTLHRWANRLTVLVFADGLLLIDGGRLTGGGRWARMLALRVGPRQASFEEAMAQSQGRTAPETGDYSTLRVLLDDRKELELGERRLSNIERLAERLKQAIEKRY